MKRGIQKDQDAQQAEASGSKKRKMKDSVQGQPSTKASKKTHKDDQGSSAGSSSSSSSSTPPLKGSPKQGSPEKEGPAAAYNAEKIAVWNRVYHQLLVVADKEVMKYLDQIDPVDLDEFEIFCAELDRIQERSNEDLVKSENFDPDQIAYVHAQIEAIEHDERKHKIDLSIQRHPTELVRSRSVLRQTHIQGKKKFLTDSISRIIVNPDGRIDAQQLLDQYTPETRQLFMQANALAQIDEFAAIKLLGMSRSNKAGLADLITQFNQFRAAMKVMEATQNGDNGIAAELARQKALEQRMRELQAELDRSKQRLENSGITQNDDGSLAVPVPPTVDTTLLIPGQTGPGIMAPAQRLLSAAYTKFWSFGSAVAKVSTALFTVSEANEDQEGLTQGDEVPADSLMDLSAGFNTQLNLHRRPSAGSLRALASTRTVAAQASIDLNGLSFKHATPLQKALVSLDNMLQHLTQDPTRLQEVGLTRACDANHTEPFKEMMRSDPAALTSDVINSQLRGKCSPTQNAVFALKMVLMKTDLAADNELAGTAMDIFAKANPTKSFVSLVHDFHQAQAYEQARLLHNIMHLLHLINQHSAHNQMPVDNLHSMFAEVFYGLTQNRVSLQTVTPTSTGIKRDITALGTQFKNDLGSNSPFAQSYATQYPKEERMVLEQLSRVRQRSLSPVNS